MGFRLQQKWMTLNINLLLCHPCYAYCYQTAEGRMMLTFRTNRHLLSNYNTIHTYCILVKASSSKKKYFSYARETTRSLIRFRLTSSIIPITKHKIAFLGHPMGASGTMQVLYMLVLMQTNFVAAFHQQNASFTRKTAS